MAMMLAPRTDRVRANENSAISGRASEVADIPRNAAKGASPRVDVIDLAIVAPSPAVIGRERAAADLAVVGSPKRIVLGPATGMRTRSVDPVIATVAVATVQPAIETVAVVIAATSPGAEVSKTKGTWMTGKIVALALAAARSGRRHLRAIATTIPDLPRPGLPKRRSRIRPNSASIPSRSPPTGVPRTVTWTRTGRLGGAGAANFAVGLAAPAL